MKLSYASGAPSSSVRLLIVRHARAATDPAVYPDARRLGLSEVGIAQALGCRKAIEKFEPDKVVASPLQRALHTAELLVRDLGVTIEQHPGLVERTFPVAYGRTWNEIDGMFGEGAARRIRETPDEVSLEGVESLIEAQVRVVRAFEDVLNSGASRIVVVAHGGPHSWFVGYVLGAPLALHRRITLERLHGTILDASADGPLRLRVLNVPLAALAAVPDMAAVYE